MASKSVRLYRGKASLEKSQHPITGRLEGLLEDFRAKKAGHVAVGVIDGSGGEQTEDGITIAGLAVVHEFGAPKAGIPARLPMTLTLEQKAEAIQEAQRRLGLSIMQGRPTAEALGLLGEFVSSEIRNTIQQGLEPPNSEKTIERKGSSKPLIDSGRLINSYTYDVRLPEEK